MTECTGVWILKNHKRFIYNIISKKIKIIKEKKRLHRTKTIPTFETMM
jgi:hypothetical protein